jgi:hypothetical protein
VIFKDGVYRMWYTTEANGPDTGINYAESANGTDWTSQGVVLPVGGDGEWDSFHLGGVAVICDGGQYRLWYGGRQSGLPVEIGYATSPDGLDWVRDAGNPVLSEASSSPTASVYPGTVIQDGGQLQMWYMYLGSAEPAVYHATSANAITWVVTGPVLVGETGAWDAAGAYEPAVVQHETTYEMWYGSGSGIGQAESADGVAWTKSGGNPVLTGGVWYDQAGAATVVLNGGVYRMWYSGSDGATWRLGYATALSLDPDVPDLTVTPSPADFPDTPVGASSPMDLTITSTGIATLAVNDITSDSPAFVVAATPTRPFDTDPGATQDVTVTFSPTVEGPQTGNITITHNAPDSPTVVVVTGTGTSAPGATITVADTQGQVDETATVSVDVTNLTDIGVAAIELILTYDEALLAPVNDGVNTTAATPTGLIPIDWAVLQNVPTPGELRVALAGESTDPIIGGGTIVDITFNVLPTATVGATSLLTLTTASLNEGGVLSTSVTGTFTVVEFIYGDVTGNGSVSPYDATWVLDCVTAELIGESCVFPIEVITPPWSTVPFRPEEARDVADVDGDGLITANDAVVILQYVVGLVDTLPWPTAPATPPAVALTAAVFDVTQTSERPGARVTVSLDVSAMLDARAGELVLDFDAELLRPVDVSLRSGSSDSDSGRPLVTQREGDGRVAVAFASARPLDGSGAVLEVTFEATGSVQRPRQGVIRASHLRLNRSVIETEFAFPFRVEPFANRLMANYPNPFNPDTWIPFELSDAADVTVRVYGLDGGLVRTLELGHRAVGEYVQRDDAAYWDGKNARGESVASGVYIYELTAGDYHAVRRMVVRK